MLSLYTYTHWRPLNLARNAALPVPRLLCVSIADLCSTAASGPVADILLAIDAAPLLKVHARAPYSRTTFMCSPHTYDRLRPA